MTQPQLDELIKVFPELARRAGLVWSIRPGTVTLATATHEALVQLDGDAINSPIPCVSMIGAMMPGMRCWVIEAGIKGETGNYIVGSPAKLARIYHALQACDSTLTPLPTGAASATQISGTRIEVDTPPCRYEVTAVADMEVSGAGVTTIVAALAIDDNATPLGGAFESALILSDVTAGTERNQGTQQWSGELAAGSHSFELWGFRTAAAGTQSIQATHTTIKVDLFA